MKVLVVFALSCVASVLSASTTPAPQAAVTSKTTHVTHHHPHHHPHASKEPAVTENYLFNYDPSAHRVMVVSGHTCYLYNPSDNEKLNIHDAHLFRTMESDLIDLINSGASFSTLSHPDLALMSKTFGKRCRANFTIYGVN